MKISPARKSAFEILFKIEKEKAFSSILLPIYAENLLPKDRSLCYEITLGVLRNKIYLDKIIKLLAEKNIKKFDIEVLNALRMGLYQMKLLDRIPNYSAINDSVNLVKYAKKKSASGFVNAVLRRASREEIEFDFKDRAEKLSVKTSHPCWLIEKWSEQFGFEETKKIAFKNNEAPDLAFRFTIKFFKKDKQEREKILKNLSENKKTRESEYLKNCYIAKNLTDDLRVLAEKDLIYFQDEASQMVARCVDIKGKQKFLDVCASPGSKTTLIAAELFEKGLKQTIFAGDLYKHRIKILVENCQRQSVNCVNFVQYDAENSLPFGDESFDCVLVDAPCSGTGTIRHNPEIRYLLKKDDFIELQKKQLEILKNASKLIKVGGRIIYSTCSLEVEENEEVIERFLSEETVFGKVTPNTPKKFLTEENFVRTLPHRNNMDGFFAAVLEKN